VSFTQILFISIICAFVIPFCIYLFSRLQMTAWLNAFDDFLKKKAGEDEEEEE
jgi:hypothetical protein